MKGARPVRPPPWASATVVTHAAPPWTTRAGSGTTVRPSPLSGDVARELDVLTAAAAPANDAELPPAPPRPTLSLIPGEKREGSIPPSSRRPPASRGPLEARVVTLGEALSEARQEAAHLRAELEIARRAFAAQAETFEREKEELVRDATAELLKLALAVARRVVLREVSVDPSLVATWAREVIDAAGLGESITIAVADDLGVPPEAFGDLAPRVSTDPSLPSGACEVRDGPRSIDVSAEARLAIVGETLLAAGGER